jgi:hypothetical protein
MHGDPLWRQILCWCAVATFFTLPFAILLYHLIAVEVSSLHFEEYLDKHPGDFRYIANFYQTNTALLIALAGLHSWDKRLNGKSKTAVSQPSLESAREKTK